MAADEIDLTALDDDVCLFQVHTIITNGFDFPSFEDNTGFVFFLDEEIVKGFFILGDAHDVTDRLKLAFYSS